MHVLDTRVAVGAEGDGCLLDLDYLLQLLDLPASLCLEVLAFRRHFNELSQKLDKPRPHLHSAASDDTCQVVLELLAALSNHMCLPLC